MKKILVVLLTVFMAFSMVGCTEKKPKEKQTVTIWHTYTEAQKEYLEKAASDFNAAHEGEIEVVVESQEYKGFSRCFKSRSIRRSYFFRRWKDACITINVLWPSIILQS